MNRLASRNPTVGVAIATIGRGTLSEVLESVLRQTVPVSEIVICVDGREYLELVRDQLLSLDRQQIIRIIVNEENLGASESYNIAINCLETDLICLASDDDTWFPNKVEGQLIALRSFGNEAIVLTSVAYSDESARVRIRPRTLLSGYSDPILQIIRARPGMRRAARYAPMASAMFPNFSGRIQFDTTLGAYEDLWWLHEAFKIGVPTIQLNLVGIRGKVSHNRSSKRINGDLLNFSSRLEDLELGLGTRFLKYHLARAAVLSGEILTLRAIHKYSNHKFKTNIVDILLTSWQWPLALTIFMVKHFRKII